MKKYIVAFFALFMVVSANAQLRTSRTFKKEKSNIEWILRFGPSINQLAGEDFEDSGATTLWALDFGFNKPFGRSNCYWGMEIGLDSRGTKFEYNLRRANIKLSPFTVGYKIPIGEKFKIDPHLGLYASVDFANIGGMSHIDWNGERFDCGLQLGVGFWFNRLSVDLMYQRGIIETSVYDYDGYYDEDYFGFTSNFLIRLGYRF